MALPSRNLGEMMIRERLIDLNQLEQARRDQKNYGGRLGTAVVRLGFVNEKSMAEFLSKIYEITILDLNSFTPDPEALKLLPKEICEKHCVIPVSKVANQLIVAFADPSNVQARDDLSFISRTKISMVLALESSILSALEKHYGAPNQMNSLVSEMEGQTEEGATNVAIEVIEGDGASEEVPIVKFVNVVLAEAIKLKASDVHIEPYEKRFRVRYRVDGILRETIQPPPNLASAIISRVKIISRLDIAEKRRPQDGRLKVRLKTGKEVDFRVSCLPTLFGEKVVLRILDKTNLQVDLTKLGFEEDDLKMFREAIYLPQGLVLITGPTGSGKTTTIYSALAELNTVDVNISTAEDPVEFNLDGINQVQVNPEIDFKFPQALKSFLRQDPDIIMVGEIRDYETAEIAFKAASTGHMVVSTLHTNDAPSTVSRLIDMGVPPYMVTNSTTLIVAQRLLRKVCEQCSAPFEVPKEVLTDLGVHEKDLKLYGNCRRGAGCAACGDTGLRGRIAIYELMKMTPAIKEAVFRGASPLELKKIAVEKDNLRTLRHSALLKLMAGRTTVEEVINSSVRDDAE